MKKQQLESFIKRTKFLFGGDNVDYTLWRTQSNSWNLIVYGNQPIYMNEYLNTLADCYDKYIAKLCCKLDINKETLLKISKKPSLALLLGGNK